ncbi:Multidrug resistance protein MdtN [Anatilimnocola aggregata]|uniref:Multidrug resistance protein MdtN n=1 Tax=Anatilimnocola aggregata TaxID=2528021 RepID=A0A517YAY0_9BACT|nr:HlyD family efflux transporter periplasmic adaptor subunit [Anatilimnocola aggregata]QDU27397.1 Multidrug resistance protein MdtN [Anatilimnocola aggregata]
MFRKLILYVVPLGALSMLVFGVFHILSAEQELPKLQPPTLPARNPYLKSIAAAGIVEPRSENIAIGSPLSGVVLEVFVPSDKVGQEVTAGTPLFRVDDRHLKSQLAWQTASLRAAEAQLAKLDMMPRPEELPPAEARVAAAEAKVRLWLDQYNRSAKLLGSGAIGAEENNTKRMTYEESLAQQAQATAELNELKAGAWKPDKLIAQAAIEQAKAQMEMTKTDIERCLVRAPTSGQILQVSVRPGEFVSAPPNKELIVLGDLARLRVRVDIDEQDIARFSKGMPAKAYARGNNIRPIKLNFVRVEPYVVPKRSLTGDNTERVDTRVLQVIYEVDDTAEALYVGQQMDVFLDSGEPAVLTTAM